jgi:hypothetical protein
MLAYLLVGKARVSISIETVSTSGTIGTLERVELASFA